MLNLSVDRAPARWLIRIAIRKAKAAAEAAGVDWEDADIRVRLPTRGACLVKLPGHVAFIQAAGAPHVFPPTSFP